MKLPIRVRLTFTYGAILMLVIAALELAGYLSVRAAMDALVDQELKSRLAGIEDHMNRHVTRYGWPKTGADLSVHPAFQPSLLAIRSGSGDLLYEGQVMRGIATPAFSGFATGEAGATGLRLLSAHRVIQGAIYSILLGTDLHVPLAILRRLWLIILISLPVLTVVSACIGHWMSGRALAPLREMIDAGLSIDWRRLNQRVPVPATGDELQQLAETFNGMLERVEDGFRTMAEFTANASHELRTPVAIVRATAEIALLRPRAREDSDRQALERVLRESERTSALLENMLELARADARADDRCVEWLDLAASLREACEQVAPLAAAREIHLRAPDGAGGALVLGDGDQLRRLWLILLDNAIKYTPPGGHVSAQVHVTPKREVIGEVSDTGIGIAAEHQRFIFERFYRTDKTRSRAAGGNGLGLAIAREIATIHDAEVGVESQPGAGSHFFVRFAHAKAAACEVPLGFEGKKALK